MDKLSEILIKLGLFSPVSVLPLLGAGAAISKAGALATSGAKWWKGMQQKAKAKKINDRRAVKKVQDETIENKSMYANALKGEDAASSRARENIQQGVASTVGQAKRSVSDGGGVLSALTASNQAAGQAERDVAADEAVRKTNLMSQLAAANTALAEEKDSVWDYNRRQKQEEAKAEKKNLLDAAAANKMEGAKGMIAAGAKIAGGDKGEAGSSGPQKISKRAQKNNAKLNTDKTKMAKGKQVKGLKKPAGGGIMGIMNSMGY